LIYSAAIESGHLPASIAQPHRSRRPALANQRPQAPCVDGGCSRIRDAIRREANLLSLVSRNRPRRTGMGNGAVVPLRLYPAIMI
jgi:hypothetical protein